MLAELLASVSVNVNVIVSGRPSVVSNSNTEQGSRSLCTICFQY